MNSTEPRLHHVTCASTAGLHRMAYWEWGRPDNPRVLVCVHGLSRQGRDFDTLAAQMSDTYRVICPDVVGRGQSDRLADPSGYGIPQYVSDMVTMLAALQAEVIDWAGTSMGGLIGLGVAALDGSPLRRLVLNDVGPTLEPVAIARIGQYLGAPVRWPSVEAAAQAMAMVSQGFGPHTPEQWLALSRPQVVSDGQGGFLPHYDPAIAVPFRAITPQMAELGQALLWQAWDRLRLPVLLLRGADSDLLSRDTAEAMTKRGPRARLHEFAGVGHAPTLVQADQREVVAQFLLAP
jgi:pimeloyl-ACP methyl ester carboxylesterase